MPSLLDDASLPTDACGLQKDLEELDKRLDACRDEIRSLMEAENPETGIFRATEIHAAKQLLSMLRYQKDLRSAHLNRLRLEADA